MIKVFFLIFEPGKTWDKIALAKRGFTYLSVVQLLPLILGCTLAEAWGLHVHGKWQPEFHMFKTTFTNQDVIVFATLQFLLTMGVVFVSALLVLKIAQTFHDRLTFLQPFTVIVYGFSPMFLFRFLDYFASMHPAVTWMLGMGLTTWILYSGIPRVMQPDPTHAFGVYLSTMIVVILTSGLARVLTAMYVLGYMDLQHSWLSRKLGHFLGH
jgi:hypothetical protein